LTSWGASSVKGITIDEGGGLRALQAEQGYRNEQYDLYRIFHIFCGLVNIDAAMACTQ
jgi:hypothetical protein